MFDNSSASWDFSTRVQFYLLLLVAAAFSIRSIYGEDFGFHLAMARWMIENGSLPDLDPLTYTATQNKYIDLNWGYQLINYAVWKLAGPSGLIFLNSAFFIGAVYVTLSHVRTSLGWLMPWILLISILAISPSLEVRPHSVSWFLLALVIRQLQLFSTGSLKAMRWIPLIMIIWVNMHSLFILGLLIFGIYWAGTWMNRREHFKQASLFFGVSILVCLINPYGLRGLLFPFEQATALESGNIFKENIRELQAPFSFTTYEWSGILKDWHFFDLFLGVVALMLFRLRKELRFQDWAMVAIFSYFAITAAKNIGYMVFAVLPLILNSVKRDKGPSPMAMRRIAAAFTTVSVLLLLSILTNAFYIHYRTSYRFGLGISTSNLPVKAVEFLTANKVKGKIFNQLDYGGYIRFFLDQPPSIDGRLDVMGPEIFKEQVMADSDSKKTELLKKISPDLILFSYFSTPDWLRYLQKRPDWRLVHADETTALYFRNGFRDDVTLLSEDDFISRLHYPSADLSEEMTRNGISSFPFSGLLTPQYYPEAEFNAVAFSFYYGWRKAAYRIMGTAFSRSTKDYPELYLNAGTIFFQDKNAAGSLYCYEKYLQTEVNEMVSERVKFLKKL